MEGMTPGRMEALSAMSAPPPAAPEEGDELDQDGDGEVTLGEIASALGELIAGGTLPPEMTQDLTQAQELIAKHAGEEEAPPSDDEAAEGEETPVPTDGE